MASVVTPSRYSPRGLSVPFRPTALAGVPLASVIPVPVGSALAGALIGALYTETIAVSGGVAPFTYSVASGALPTGLTLGSSSGIISGTPSVVGTFAFTIQCSDANGYVATSAFSISVTAPATGSVGGNYAWIG